jgi:urease subunit gamma
MMLSPREVEKLYVYVVADLARKRRDRGLKLNYSEAIALITEAILEGARDGRSVADLMELGRTIVSRDDVMPGVPELVPRPDRLRPSGGARPCEEPRWPSQPTTSSLMARSS